MNKDDKKYQKSFLDATSEILSLRKQIKDLKQECKFLREENNSLKHLHSPEYSRKKSQQPFSNFDTLKKLEIFKSLFRGRTDVYPKRWESKNGRSGYSPACDNEWKPNICEKPRIKCNQCENRSFSSLDDQVFYDHLSGKQTIGIYPLLQDDSCWFLAVDFDKSNWKDDVLAYLETCDELGISASLERSRSGNGGHVWLFFSEPIPAVMARQLGNMILTKTMDNRIEIGFDSYDRLFPNQDTMPKGGFGNLIALPLQKQQRNQGNSVFIDRSFQPFTDQWDYLASIGRLSKIQLEELLEAQKDSPDLSLETETPWITKSNSVESKSLSKEILPAKITIVIANSLYIEKATLPGMLLNQLIHLAAFNNPEFFKAQAMRMSTYDKPRVIACHDDLAQHIALPRGCLSDAKDLLEGHKITVETIDECTKGKPLKAGFKGKLRAEQKETIKALRCHDFGVLSATTAFGKTVIAAKMIAIRKRSTLILVHRKQLLEQWRERLANFLSVSIDDIGQIGGGKNKPNGTLDIALLQSLYRNNKVHDAVDKYGQIIVDECHHISAFSFEQVLKQAKAKYVLGLTATPIRKDGHHPIIFMQCGQIRYQVNVKQAATERPFEHFMIPQFTDFVLPSSEDKLTIQQIYNLLSEEKKRNDKIISDVISCIKEGRSPLLLTERISHLKELAKLLEDKIENVVVLHGGMGKKKLLESQEQLKTIKHDEERLILSTGKYIGEGFDDPQLDTLFLAMPISWKGTLHQYAGRLHRLYDRKKEVRIYDYVDDHIPVLQRMYAKRKSGYRAMGYSIKAEQELFLI